MNRTKKTLIFIVCLSINHLSGTEVLLKPIGLSFTINLADWAAPNYKPQNVPDQIVVKPNDKPDNFEFTLLKDGKTKALFVKAALLNPKTDYSATDIGQYESEIKDDGINLKDPGVHEEISKFAGYDCYRVTSVELGINNTPIMSTLTYVIYAQGLCYEITAVTYGGPPPELDPVLKSMLASMAFIPTEKTSEAASKTEKSKTSVIVNGNFL
jgi:hypothetical protein